MCASANFLYLGLYRVIAHRVTNRIRSRMPQLATFVGDESHIADEILHAELTRMRTSAPVPPPHPSGPNAMHVHNHLTRMDPLLPRHWYV